MVFNKNVNSNTGAEILALCGTIQPQQYEKHMGIPTFIGRARKRAFFEIK